MATYTTTPMSTIRNRNTGHWFDPSTMRFFRTRLPRTGIMLADGRALFVTSEQFVGSDHVAAPRRFTIRMQRPDGSVDTLAGFQDYATAHAAKTAMLAYARVA